MTATSSDLAPWSGKFPQASRFTNENQMGHVHLQMGAYVFIWTEWGGE